MRSSGAIFLAGAVSVMLAAGLGFAGAVLLLGATSVEKESPNAWAKRQAPRENAPIMTVVPESGPSGHVVPGEQLLGATPAVVRSDQANAQALASPGEVPGAKPERRTAGSANKLSTDKKSRPKPPRSEKKKGLVVDDEGDSRGASLRVSTDSINGPGGIRNDY
jgi:hypothetical protein